VKEPQGALFPVASEAGGDGRLDMLARDVGVVLERHGYPRVNGRDRAELEKRLVAFIYGARGAEGELEQRLNGTAAPLVSPEGKLDSYDCAAVAHEIRRKRGAEGAIVVAIDEQNRVHIGCAVEPQSQADFLASKVMSVLDDVSHDAIQDVVLDLVVNEKGQPS
jgi:hypothetical protein